MFCGTFSHTLIELRMHIAPRRTSSLSSVDQLANAHFKLSTNLCHSEHSIFTLPNAFTNQII